MYFKNAIIFIAKIKNPSLPYSLDVAYISLDMCGWEGCIVTRLHKKPSCRLGKCLNVIFFLSI